MPENLTITEVEAVIRTAFADVKYPGDNRITDCSYKATFGECQECRDIAKHFKGTTWHEHTVKTVQQQDSALSFFTDEAFHYYLPVFMLADLEDAAEADYMGQSILFHLGPGTGYHEASRKSRLRRFSREQREAISDYLRWFGQSFESDMNQTEATIEALRVTD